MAFSFAILQERFFLRTLQSQPHPRWLRRSIDFTEYAALLAMSLWLILVAIDVGSEITTEMATLRWRSLSLFWPILIAEVAMIALTTKSHNDKNKKEVRRLNNEH